MKYKYVGEAERVFPHLGITVQPGDEFDAPAGLDIADVVSADAKSVFSQKPKATVDEVKDENPTDPSAASDTTLGE